MTILVVLDTNIPLLLARGLFNLDIELERILPQDHKIIFLSACLKELEHLSKKSTKLAQAVKFAKQFLERYEIIDFNPQNIKETDDKIVAFAKENKGKILVATNDKQLIKQLRKNALPVLFIKTRGHFELIGSIY